MMHIDTIAIQRIFRIRFLTGCIKRLPLRDQSRCRGALPENILTERIRSIANRTSAIFYSPAREEIALAGRNVQIVTFAFSVRIHICFFSLHSSVRVYPGRRGVVTAIRIYPQAIGFGSVFQNNRNFRNTRRDSVIRGCFAPLCSIIIVKTISRQPVGASRDFHIGFRSAI